MSPRLDLCARCQDWEARYHELVKELLAMKRDGFTAAPAMPQLAEPPQLDAEIELAISENFDRNGPEGRQQQTLAWAMKRAGKTPEEIATLIRRGEPLSL